MLRKKRTIWPILFILIVFLSRIASSEERESFKPKFNIKINWGLRYMSVGDINTHLESLDSYISQMTYYQGGKTKKINNYGPDLEGELSLEVSPKFAIALGVGYIFGKSKSDFETLGSFPLQTPIISPLYWHHFIFETKVEAISLRLGIYNAFPLSSRINIFLNNGLDYYFSRATLNKNLLPQALEDFTIGNEKYHEYHINSNGFGFHSGIGFEYNISFYLAFVLEIQGRYAKIKNLKGNRSYYSWGGIEREKGILYIGERDLFSEGYGKNCPDLIFSESKPIGDEFQNIREASLDFSGISLRIGIKVKLF
ncbi:hypothetical protein ES705_18664 [subsurface metagenome]